MKKLLTLVIVAAISMGLQTQENVVLKGFAQITKGQADEIVFEYIQKEITRPYYLYTNDDLPDENGIITIVTSKGEIFSTKYPCWVYCIDEWSDVNGPHPFVLLFINQTDGDILEVKTRNSFINNMDNWLIMHTPTNAPNIQRDGEIVISPNPVEDFLYIHYSGVIDGIKIYDLTGNQVFYKSFQGATDYKCNIAFLSKGFYIVNFLDKKGTITSNKIIKN